MKINLLATVVLVLLLAASFSRAEDWTVNGKTYKNIIVTKVEPDVVHIMYDGGIGSVNLSDLPPNLQKKFNFDPSKATAATQQKQASQAAAVADLKAHSVPLADSNASTPDAVNPTPDAASPTPDAATTPDSVAPTPQVDTLAGLDTSSKIYQMLSGTGAKYNFDKFKEKAEIQSKEFDLGNGVTITLYATSDTANLYKPDSYYALIYSASTEWRFLKDSDIDIKADKVLIERKNASDPKYADTHEDGTVSEMLDCDLSADDLKQIANSSVLYFRIATTEFNLAQVQQGIKLFYDATQTLPDKPADKTATATSSP